MPFPLERVQDPTAQRNFDLIARALDGLQMFDFYGNGSPENVITANKGATYRRLDGTAGSLLYVKTTNGVATGWSAYA